jgi:hypothetical protein
MNVWKNRTLLCASVGFSILGATAAQAQSPQPIQPGQSCEFGRKPQTYALVQTTEGDLRVRATPGGAIIGAIPKNWAVIPVRVDSTGNWVRITSHVGEVTQGGRSGIAFGNAPYFRTGWVAARFLKRLPGKYCDKPQITSQLVRSQLTAQDILVQEDWLDLGDRIAHQG